MVASGLHRSAEKRIQQGGFRLSKELLLLFLAALMAIVYHSYVSREKYIEKLQKDRVAAIAERDDLQRRHRELEHKYRELLTDQGVERVARERLKLVRKGEILYIPQKKGEVGKGITGAAPSSGGQGAVEGTQP